MMSIELNLNLKEETKELKIELLKKTVSIRCPESQEEELLLAAELLEERLQSLQHGGTVWNRDAMLAITALNLMDEVLRLNKELSGRAESNSPSFEQLNKIIKKIDAQCCKEN